MTSTNPPPSSSHAPGRRLAGHAQLDAIADPYQARRKPHEPTLCPQCGAVYQAGRWQWAPRPEGAEEEPCPACRRVADHFPAGIVTLTGSLVAVHGAEMIRLARNQEEAERPEHPLNRIMSVEENPERIVIATTDIHLPRRIGEAIERAYRGALTFNYEEDGYFVRVDWNHA